MDTWQLQRLRVPELKGILRRLGLRVGGNKDALVRRLADYAASGDHARTSVSDLIRQHDQPYVPTIAAAPSYASSVPQLRRFVPYPFIVVDRQLLSPMFVDQFQMRLGMVLQFVVPGGLGSARVFLRCGVQPKDRIRKDPPFQDQFQRICFRLNDRILATGGITRPFDITAECRLSNTLAFRCDNPQYAALIEIFVARNIESGSLVRKLHRIPAEETLTLVRKKLHPDEDDIVVTTTACTVSLQCPVTKTKMALPGRSTECSHLQCFDVAFFLKMNERRPTWRCPVCDKFLALPTLAVDTFFENILRGSGAANLIQLDEAGRWTAIDEPDAPAASQRESAQGQSTPSTPSTPVSEALASVPAAAAAAGTPVFRFASSLLNGAAPGLCPLPGDPEFDAHDEEFFDEAAAQLFERELTLPHPKRARMTSTGTVHDPICLD